LKDQLGPLGPDRLRSLAGVGILRGRFQVDLDLAIAGRAPELAMTLEPKTRLLERVPAVAAGDRH